LNAAAEEVEDKKEQQIIKKFLERQAAAKKAN
jgi:hypothetical protein